ncbi:MAG: GDP-mannose 4,6-dehydratase [Rudaea sp.]
MITGISGFAGSYLAEHLLSLPSCDLWGVSLGPTENIDGLRDRIHYLPEDLADPSAAERVLITARPDLIFHLAAQAFVPVSWQDPWSTMENNIRAEVNLLHLVAKHEIPSRILIVGSNEEYGRVEPDDLPITEETALRPDSPYGVSKIAQDFLALQYFISHNLYTVRLRPFNHSGPRQNDRFVASDFAKQIAEIEAGEREPVIHVGNLEASRDFTDVRDMVRAYVLALERGVPGEVYNVGSGRAYSIRQLLDFYLSQTDAPVRVQADPGRSRPSDTPVTLCDSTKFRRQTGWEPEIPFEQTLRDTLDYWRARVKGVKKQTA